jgi:oxygen-independent coproporphyrinogen-3 oxidase
MAALLKETELQKDYLENETVETIYFGGGTPSLLTTNELQFQIDKIKQVFNVAQEAEITLETNPDDITEENLLSWKEAGINRLSIGVQSFFDEDLQWMSRSHTAKQALASLEKVKKYFSNISIDLIYGYALLTNEKWKQNLESALSFDIPHLSCYALTVEPKTPLHKMIREKKTVDVNPDLQSEQFLWLMQWMEEAGYEHYEISNFARPGFRSRHNSTYWLGKKYLGLGPSAHSYNMESRQWNVSNNNLYIESIGKGFIPFEKEVLTPVQKLNEYIMTSLRTIEGLHLEKLDETSGNQVRIAGQKYIDSGLMKLDNQHLILTNDGKLLADGIAAALFF